MSDGISQSRFALAVAGALGAGLFGGFFVDRLSSQDDVRDYLLENPEILTEMVQALQTKEARKQLADVRSELETPYPGAVLGNPQGTVTLVEFTDYACGYCRASAAAVDELIAANPDLRVVIREWPILSDESVDAAKMALAAARQGKYGAFHRAMYAGDAISAGSIEAAARTAGLDPDKAAADIADPSLETELIQNEAIARRMGFDGTPAWIVGDTVLAGAVGKDALADAIQAARE